MPIYAPYVEGQPRARATIAQARGALLPRDRWQAGSPGSCRAELRRVFSTRSDAYCRLKRWPAWGQRPVSPHPVLPDASAEQPPPGDAEQRADWHPQVRAVLAGARVVPE